MGDRPTVHLIHGFNSWKSGQGTVDKLAPFFHDQGYNVVDHDYGWVFLLRLRFVNSRAVEQIQDQIDRGDIIVAFSNGALIAWHLVEAGARPSAVVCIQPALRRDTPWPVWLPVLCVYNSKDMAVSMGRAWGRLASTWKRHGWGAAGRHGFLQRGNISNMRTDVPPEPAEGHGGIWSTAPLLYWGDRIVSWCSAQWAGWTSRQNEV